MIQTEKAKNIKHMHTQKRNTKELYETMERSDLFIAEVDKEKKKSQDNSIDQIFRRRKVSQTIKKTECIHRYMQKEENEQGVRQV